MLEMKRFFLVILSFAVVIALSSSAVCAGSGLGCQELAAEYGVGVGELANPQAMSGEYDSFMSLTPAQQAMKWRAFFLNFAQSRKDLTRGQLEIIEKIVDLGTIDFFSIKKGSQRWVTDVADPMDALMVKAAVEFPESLFESRPFKKGFVQAWLYFSGINNYAFVDDCSCAPLESSCQGGPGPGKRCIASTCVTQCVCVNGNCSYLIGRCVGHGVE